jgi:hypothetical protein
VYAAVLGIAVFGTGIAVGQRTSTSKFAKYLRPGYRTDMALITLEANLNLVRGMVPLSEGISIPQIFFNVQANQPQASAYISSDFENASLDSVKSKITEKYYFSYFELKQSIPELSEDDFVLRVIRYTTDPDKKLFAECKHGKIVFH